MDLLLVVGVILPETDHRCRTRSRYLLLGSGHLHVSVEGVVHELIMLMRHVRSAPRMRSSRRS
jgi:hypothetical protein